MSETFTIFTFLNIQKIKMRTPNFLYIETYGCTANKNNTEIMSALLSQAGLEKTSNPEIADIIILNTCIVKGKTEDKIRNRIKELKKLGKPIIIAGCMPDVYGKELIDKNIFLLSTNHTTDVTTLIRKICENKFNDKEQKEFLEKQNEIKLGNKIRENKTIGITQICGGCTGNCSFCQTKIAKGNIFSYPEEKILENIKKDIASGCKEIFITSQDNSAYGLDKKERKLPDLLKKILSLDGKFKIRIGMMNVNNLFPILNEMLEIYKDEKIFKFLHLPLQSGSNKILKEMNRQYKAEDFLKIIKEFKKEIPDITIETDVIAGYPKEQEEDFRETIKILEKIKPDFFNISKFWPRKFTKAASLKPLPAATTITRAKKLMAICKKNAKENNQKQEGKIKKIIIDKKLFGNVREINFSEHPKNPTKEGFFDIYSGRDESFRLVLVKSDKNILNKTIRVRITKTEMLHLLGEVC